MRKILLIMIVTSFLFSNEIRIDINNTYIQGIATDAKVRERESGSYRAGYEAGKKYRICWDRFPNDIVKCMKNFQKENK